MIEERLKHVADIRVSSVDKTTTAGDPDVRLCNYTDVYYNERITGALGFMAATATEEQRATFRLKQGDVVLTKDSETADDIGVSALVAEDVPDLVCGYHLAVVRARTGRTVGGYLRWVIASTVARQQMSAAATGVTRFGLRAAAIADLPIPVPPIATQRAIADYLDRETARIDALIAAQRRMVELLGEELYVTRIDLVIDRTTDDRREGPTWLGSIPEGWDLKRLKFVAKMESGHTPNKQVEAYWIDCTIPWITLNDVSDLETGWRFVDPQNYVNELGLQNSSAHVLPENAVVLSRDATVGRSALLGRPMAVSQHFVAWVCGPELMPEYLLNVLRGPMQHHFGSLTAGATIATIGMPDLKQLVVPVPPLEEQARIVRDIAAAETLAAKTVLRVKRQIDLLKERRQALITAAVTGQLEIPEAA